MPLTEEKAAEIDSIYRFERGLEVLALLVVPVVALLVIVWLRAGGGSNGEWGGFTVGPVDGRVGHTYFVPVLMDDVSADVRSLTPHVVEDTTDARIGVAVCELADGPTPAIGTDTPPCTAVTPLRPGRLELGTMRHHRLLMYSVTPRRPGHVRIDGVTVGVDAGIGVAGIPIGAGFQADARP